MSNKLEQMSQSMSSMDAKLEGLGERLSGVEMQVQSCKTTLDRHESDIQFLLKHVRESEVSKKQFEERAKVVESRLAMAEQQEFTMSDDSFDRLPNPTVIKANAKVNLSKDAFVSAFCTLIENASLPKDCFRVPGPPVSQFFTVQFSGSPNLAKDRVSKVLNSLRKDDGHWERFLVKDPSDQFVQVYLGADKSPKQIRTEVLSKKLGGIWEGMGFSEIHVKRKQGQVCINWRPIAMVEVANRDSAEILWDSEYALSLAINRERVCELFKDAPRTAGSPIKWEKLSSS